MGSRSCGGTFLDNRGLDGVVPRRKYRFKKLQRDVR
jgi:hypothetical protein